MNGWKIYWFALAMALLTALLTACTIPRTAEEKAGDISAEFAPPLITGAQPVTVVGIEPKEQAVQVEDLVVVEVRVNEVTNLMAINLELRFPAGILQVEDASDGKPGIQIEPGDFLTADFIVKNEADNDAGKILFALTQVDPTPPRSGSGVLARITFRALADGEAQIDFAMTQLVAIIDDNPVEVPVIADSGKITVGAGAAPPTSTLTPTLPPPTPTPVVGTGTPPTPTTTALPPTATPVFPTATPTSTLVAPIPTPLPAPTPVPLADVPKIPIPPGATYGFCYRVQPGDTLYSIGQKFGVNPSFINLINSLDPPGYVFAYQALFIPESYGRGPNVYRVRLGDTLDKIADDCHLPVDFLAQVNMLKPDDLLTLKAGTEVKLEDGSTVILAQDTIRIEHLLIPLPPFPSPSRYPYPGGVSPPVSPPGCYAYPCN